MHRRLPLRPFALALLVLLPCCKGKMMRGSVNNQGKPVAGARVRLFAEEQLQAFFRGRGAEAHDRYLDLLEAWSLEGRAMTGQAFDKREEPKPIATKDDIQIYGSSGSDSWVYYFTYNPALHGSAEAQKLAQQALDDAEARGDIPHARKRPIVPTEHGKDHRPLVAAARDRVLREEGSIFDELETPPLAETFTDQQGRYQLPLKFKEDRAALIIQATLTFPEGERRCSWGLWVSRALDHPLDLDQGALLSFRPPGSVLRQE